MSEREVSKISDFSVLLMLGVDRARLPQDTHLTYSFLETLCFTLPLSSYSTGRVCCY